MDSARLIYATKPHAGERWILERTRKGLVLLDEDEEVVTSIPTAEAGLRIRFPSFWASNKYLVVVGKKGEQFPFEPKPKALDIVRDLVADCADADPAATAAAFKAKAKRDLLIGGGSFLLGVVITCLSFMFPSSNGKFVMMTGLIFVGLLEIGRGIYFANKASQLGRVRDDDYDDHDDDDA
jgi:hypothetical protein